MVFQWLGLWIFTTQAQGSVLGQETKILQASRYGEKKEKKKIPPPFQNIIKPQN